MQHIICKTAVDELDHATFEPLGVSHVLLKFHIVHKTCQLLEAK